ncbi:MAG: RDD family protein [Proteobacteria bacterium]|nr:RDD family protein [Pseudomonadota bacterium]
MNKKSRVQTNISELLPAPPFRRFAALVYDSFIVFSWLLLATFFALVLNKGQSLLAYRWLFLAYLFFSTGFCLAWFWSHGQTLGMLAWKIKLIDNNGKRLTLIKAFKRYVIAFFSLSCGSIGFLWCLIDKDKQTLHDRLGKTRLIIAPFSKKTSRSLKKAA